MVDLKELEETARRLERTLMPMTAQIVREAIDEIKTLRAAQSPPLEKEHG